MMSSIEGKNVFVSGADGFIGSHLVELLVGLGANVRALTYYNSWNSIGWLKDVDDDILGNVEIIPGDIRDTERIRSSISGCEYVYHLSSLIGIPYSYHAPRSYVETNIIGALNVLESCRNSDTLTRLLHISTSEVYGSAQTVPIREDHPLVGQSPYSATKIGADHLADSFYRSFGLPVVIARPFNTFGPRQTARAVIPTIASQLLSGCESLTLGSLSPTRDFNYVTDTAAGMIALADCVEAEGKVVNIGSGEEWSIQQTVEMLMAITGKKVPIVNDKSRIRPGKSEVNRLLADNKLIHKLTGWQSQVSFKSGLENTVSWIEKNIDCFDPEAYKI